MKTMLTLFAAAALFIAGCNASKDAVKPPKAPKAPKPVASAQEDRGQKQPTPVETPPVKDEKPAAEDKNKPAVEDKKAVVEEKKRDDAWTVTAVGLTPEDARKVALHKAHGKVVVFLARQQPPVKWVPPLEYLQAGHFIKDEVMTVETVKADDGQEVTPKHWCTLQVEMTPSLFTKILEEDHQLIQADRQWLAGKVLAVLVALVLAVGGYFYLDEATKGFYTIALRLSAVTLVAAVGLAVWFVMH